MIQNLDARAIAFFALRDDLVHGGNLWADIGNYLFHGHAPGKSMIGRLPSPGKITELGYRCGGHSLFESWNAGQRLACFQAALESFLGPGVGLGQVKML